MGLSWSYAEEIAGIGLVGLVGLVWMRTVLGFCGGGGVFVGCGVCGAGGSWLGNTWRGEYVGGWWLGRCRSFRRSVTLISVPYCTYIHTYITNVLLLPERVLS